MLYDTLELEGYNQIKKINKYIGFKEQDWNEEINQENIDKTKSVLSYQKEFNIILEATIAGLKEELVKNNSSLVEVGADLIAILDFLILCLSFSLLC